MEIVVARGAALDVHKASVTACVRTPGPEGTRAQRVRTFDTFLTDLEALRDWLVAEGVTRVAMEATGSYWKPTISTSPSRRSTRASTRSSTLSLTTGVG